MTVRIPLTDGARLAECYRLGEVIERSSVNGTAELTVRMNGPDLARLRRSGVEVVES